MLEDTLLDVRGAEVVVFVHEEGGVVVDFDDFLYHFIVFHFMIFLYEGSNIRSDLSDCTFSIGMRIR